MPSFSQQLQNHLAKYKVRRLGVKQPGVFVYRGESLRKQHILPKELQWLNIVEPYRAEVQDFVKRHSTLKLHKYFHHLNSSQAFALNLFFPYFEGGASAQLLRALGLPATGGIKRWIPEFIPVPKEETNVDIAWINADGSWMYCEVKLTEAEFGAAKIDARHLGKLRDIYRPGLAEFLEPTLLEPAAFFENYQILRNLWLAARKPGGAVLFVLSRANKGLSRQLRDVLERTRAPLARRVHVANTEDVLHALAADRSLPPKLAAHAEMLIEKYIP